MISNPHGAPRSAEVLLTFLFLTILLGLVAWIGWLQVCDRSSGTTGTIAGEDASTPSRAKDLAPPR